MEILLYMVLPVIVIAAIAFLIGIGLEYIGNRLGANSSDPRVAQVSNLLAGANCGGCGYPGCEAYAEALVRGDAKLSDCNPTSKKCKQEISTILGIEDTGVELMTVVHCNGGHNCESRRYQGYGDCVSANIIAGGTKECAIGCMCLGSCAEVCNFNALKAQSDKGYAEVKPAFCTACGACVSQCPKDLISLIPKNAKVYIACSNHDRGKEVSSICKVGCIGCGICAKICPANAIVMDNNLPVIDYSKCIGCLDCAVRCPTKCIKFFGDPIVVNKN